MSISVPIKALNEKLSVPSYAHDGDAGLDLRSIDSLVLKPFERAMVRCGFSLAIPDGYAGLVIPRSGLAARHGISVVNAPGLVDSGYRGELKVVLINLDPHESFKIHAGDRIAQLVIIETPVVSLVPSDDLPSSDRGSCGFGSSGVQ